MSVMVMKYHDKRYCEVAKNGKIMPLDLEINDIKPNKSDMNNKDSNGNNNKKRL